MFTINCRGKIVTLQVPVVMGILNVTPDSFYQPEKNVSLLDRATQMIHEGADIIDIGGQSSRPGSERLSVQEEMNRVIPVIRMVREHFPAVVISVDTYQSAIAREAVDAGASMVNDISGGEMDAAMIPTVASLGVPYVCMHMKGVPENMQSMAHYDDVAREVLDYFIRKISICHDAGIHDIIVDPGFGFGKTIRHNFELLHRLSSFGILQKPVLSGLSRKSTIYKTLNVTAGEALNGTTVLNVIALQNGASILRVHDVKAAKEAIQLLEAYKKTASV